MLELGGFLNPIFQFITQLGGGNNTNVRALKNCVGGVIILL